MTLICLRSQNIDYNRGGGILATVRDIYRLDGGIARAAFKGLVPFFIARKILESTISTINGLDNSDNGNKSRQWPMVFLAGTLFAH